MKSLLVTGATGLLGTAVCGLVKQVFPDWGVLALCNSHGIPAGFAPGLVTHHLDLTDHGALKALFANASFDAVFHLAAHADPNGCQRQPRESHEVNVTASVRLAELCAPTQTPFCFASTDLVFDGLNPPFSEASLPHPTNLYAQQKWEAEQKLREILGEQLSVCRFPLLFGDSSFSGRNPLQGLVDSFGTHTPVPLFIDEFRTPVSTATAAAGLLVALKHRPPTLHLGGQERVSRFEFGRRLALWLGTSADHLCPARQKDVPMAAPRPPDVSLDSRLAFSLGYSPSALEGEFAKVDFLRRARNRTAPPR